MRPAGPSGNGSKSNPLAPEPAVGSLSNAADAPADENVTTGLCT